VKSEENDKDDNDNNKPDGDDDRRKKVTGTAYALGQIRKKMVLIPDWAKLYD